MNKKPCLTNSIPPLPTKKTFLLTAWGVLCKYKYMYIHHVHVCTMLYIFTCVSTLCSFDFMRFSVHVSMCGTALFIFSNFTATYRVYILYMLPVKRDIFILENVTLFSPEAVSKLIDVYLLLWLPASLLCLPHLLDTGCFPKRRFLKPNWERLAARASSAEQLWSQRL